MSALTPGADLAWKLGAAEAVASGQPLLENPLLLVGILSLEKLGTAAIELPLSPEVRQGVVEEARGIGVLLERCGLEAAVLRRLLRERIGQGSHDHQGRPVSRSPACKETFYRAAMLAGPRGISSLHLLAAICEASDAVISRTLKEAGSSLERLWTEARRGAREARGASPAGASGGEPRDSATPTLDRYGRDLTALAARGKLVPVIGRRTEILQVLQTLARATKNNPVLVGEPGVGKTAIVEALAQRAVQGKDPAVLGGRRIVELSLGALVAGTRFRGDLEERVQKVLAEAQANPEVIVFVDELHAVVGAGEVSGGGGDVADLVKPALARGDLRLIGATTIAEYRRHVESDPALARRFEVVLVSEPSREEALEILRGLRPRWEEHHQVRIDDGALAAAVDLAVRFDPERHLPDKAIDLVDKAAARTRLPLLSMALPAPPAFDSADAPTLVPPPASLAPPGTFSPDPSDHVTSRTVARVVAEKKGLPLELVAEGLAEASRPRVLDLEAFLRERILGQDEALAQVCRRLRLAHAGTREGERPLATLLFLGPTGVGKSETARLLASFLFGREKALLRFDMSEYMEEHSVARLIGSPPGYVGHEEEGQLVGRLRSQPYALVLLDEVEKAHPRVLDVCLQLFDAGRLTDGKGRTADARHAVFVLTSNLGSGEAREVPGFAGTTAAGPPPEPPALRAARRFFRPELLNRIDEVVVFRALGPEDAVRILRPRLLALCETVERQHGVRLTVDPEAESFIARSGYDPACGARELRRTVERLVEAPLSSLILDGKIRRYPAWRVAYDEGGVYVVPG